VTFVTFTCLESRTLECLFYFTNHNYQNLIASSRGPLQNFFFMNYSTKAKITPTLHFSREWWKRGGGGALRGGHVIRICLTMNLK
jgi:hypothetical protein